MPEPPPTTPTTAGARFFPCKTCGAKLQYEPGTEVLRCPYCTAENEIPRSAEQVRELPYEETVASLARQSSGATQETPIVECTGCHAMLTLASNVTSLDCPFCGRSIVATGASRNVIKPSAVLPFRVPRERAVEQFRAWIKGLWWAPGKLKQRAMLDSCLSGVYVPAWTYDCEARTSYTGQRGEAYYVTQAVMINGRRTMQRVRKIRWSPASGLVENRFDDILVLSSTSLPGRQLDALDPWDLSNAAPYREDYLAGFRAECYTIGLEQGFELAKEKAQPTINLSIRRDIGGDEQRITSKSTAYSGVTFKYVLLPVWVSAYRYHGKVYQFLVNARTGEVQGDRPWSVAKISLAVIAALVALAVVAWVVARAQ